MDEDYSSGSVDADREMTRLWRTWRTVFEMLQDRGYEVTEEEVQISLEEFKQKYSDPLGYPEYATPDNMNVFQHPKEKGR